MDIYAGRHDRPAAGSSRLDDFSAFLRIIEDDCPSGHKPFIIADDGVSRFIADPAARDQSGLGEPAISYVTNGIALLDTGSQCLHTATAAAAQAPGELFSSFCTTYAAIVKKLFNLPKVQGSGLDFLWTGERVGLAFDAADLFIDAETNYQGSHPAIGRAEIPGQFISDPWQGVTGLIDFTDGPAHRQPAAGRRTHYDLVAYGHANLRIPRAGAGLRPRARHRAVPRWIRLNPLKPGPRKAVLTGCISAV